MEPVIQALRSTLTERINSQDEIIDLISCEISKDAKKKSDLMLEISGVKQQSEQLLVSGQQNLVES